MELTGKQRRHLRALGHHTRPTVQIGSAGVSDAVAAKTTEELDHHELIKVKVGQGLPVKDIASALSEATDSHLVQVLGRTLLLYREHPEDPEIKLP